MEKANKIKIVKESVTTYPDFPKPGIIFRDIFGIFENVTAMQAMKDLIIEHVALLNIDVIVGLDSRGFLLGPLISLELNKPFVPIRKQGKLPGKTYQQSYVKEYGEDVFEIQCAALHGKKNALIVDDILATGGSLLAAEKLLKAAGVAIVECLVIMELRNLNGRALLESTVHSLLKYD